MAHAKRDLFRSQIFSPFQTGKAEENSNIRYFGASSLVLKSSIEVKAY